MISSMNYLLLTLIRELKVDFKPKQIISDELFDLTGRYLNLN